MSPPSLPTGTVSSDGRGDRTYPRSPGDTESPGYDERVVDSIPGASSSDRRPTETSVADPTSSPSVQNLRRQNDALERRLAERDLELQRVIDHYENLLAKRSREQPARTSGGRTLCARVADALDRVAANVGRLRARTLGRRL
jgi:hypothetical protein